MHTNIISENTPLHANIAIKQDDDTDITDLDDIESYYIYKEYDEPLYNIVIHEIHTILHVVFYRSSSCQVFYNPLYMFSFLILFLITIPSVFLHWLCVNYIPIRVNENVNEREFRSQGIYTATGCCLYGAIYSILCIIIEHQHYSRTLPGINQEQQMILHGIYLYLYITIIICNMIALKAIADKLYIAMKVYILSVWILDFILYALFMCNISEILQLSYVSMFLSLFINIFILFICTIIATNSIYFWNFYAIQSKRKEIYDQVYAFLLIFLVISCIFLLILLLLKYANSYFQFLNKA